jgi:predicted metal-dependent HD superfamily phosphohydrolase
MSLSLASWQRSWRELGAPLPGDALYDRVVACWSEPHRHYHTLQHLGETLAWFDTVRDLARRPGEVALGLWFHDAFYDAQRTDNEERSAKWARLSVLQAEGPAGAADRLHALIMATRHKAAPEEDADTQLLLDIDLSIFGTDAQRFDESSAQVRAEYAHVPEGSYREGRRRILGDFLARPRLYNTDYFYSRLEERARENIERELARLSQP